MNYFFKQTLIEINNDFFKELIQIDPNNKKAYMSQGIVYLKLKNYKNAIESFNKAIEISPNTHDTCAYICIRNNIKTS